MRSVLSTGVTSGLNDDAPLNILPGEFKKIVCFESKVTKGMVFQFQEGVWLLARRDTYTECHDKAFK